jgi:hypothetical protein
MSLHLPQILSSNPISRVSRVDFKRERRKKKKTQD